MIQGSANHGKIYDPVGRSDCETQIYSKARQVSDRERALETLITYINNAAQAAGWKD
jgi:hypothetical protein